SLPAPLLAVPFKILLFVMVDGWALITEALVQTIR
ncbi:MAG: flagellar biosynthetic protein FliP, partial [Gammaproteobacteria bacterium]|nr:flagellar biosynthetic protein FliP [Gammaproteobacteria bacterium]